jgi:cell division protein FtsZ
MGLSGPPSIEKLKAKRDVQGLIKASALLDESSSPSVGSHHGITHDYADEVASIAVVGVGGAGSNIVNRMIEQGIRGVELIAINTDAQALMLSHAPERLRIGDKLTKGLSSGGDPKIGEEAAQESSENIKALLEDTDMVIVTGGMGGGTGTGAAPVIARLAKEAGVLTVGVVTMPFSFEGTRRRHVAEEGIARLKACVDTLIVISNDRLLQMIGKQTGIQQAFELADDVLLQGLQGISELITIPGLINLDFADVRAVMVEGGSGLMAIGQAKGENRVQAAAEQAIHSALLDVSIEGAHGILFNITGGPDLTLHEVNEAAEIVSRAADPDANILFGAVIDPNMEDSIRITIIATGLDAVKDAKVTATEETRILELPRRTYDGEVINI